jgi:hypothetical protein
MVANSRVARWLRLVAIGMIVLLLGSTMILVVEHQTSTRSATAVSMIRDPNGDFAKRYGAASTVALVGSSTKTLTVANVTRGCGRNSFLVFTSSGPIWVDVYFQMNASDGRWSLHEISTGFRTRPEKPCSLA